MTTDLTATGNAGLLAEIQVRSARFSPAEQRVAHAVVGDPAHVFELSVTEMATYSGTSVGSVIRFCQRMDLRGFQDLKARLAREIFPARERLLDDVEQGDRAAEVVPKVLAGSARALTEGGRTIDPAVLDRLADALLGAGRIVFAAVGTSAPLAADIAYRLTTIGLPATFPADVHVQHVTARMLDRHDVCVAISHTGSTTETLAVTRTAAEAGATTAALTSFRDSPLTEIVDHLLVAGSRETSYRIEAMTSRLVHLAVLDALYVAVALRSPATAAALRATGDVLIEHRI